MSTVSTAINKELVEKLCSKNYIRQLSE